MGAPDGKYEATRLSNDGVNFKPGDIVRDKLTIKLYRVEEVRSREVTVALWNMNTKRASSIKIDMNAERLEHVGRAYESKAPEPEKQSFIVHLEFDVGCEAESAQDALKTVTAQIESLKTRSTYITVIEEQGLENDH